MGSEGGRGEGEGSEGGRAVMKQYVELVRNIELVET